MRRFFIFIPEKLFANGKKNGMIVDMNSEKQIAIFENCSCKQKRMVEAAMGKVWVLEWIRLF